MSWMRDVRPGIDSNPPWTPLSLKAAAELWEGVLASGSPGEQGPSPSAFRLPSASREHVSLTQTALDVTAERVTRRMQGIQGPPSPLLQSPESVPSPLLPFSFPLLCLLTPPRLKHPAPSDLQALVLKCKELLWKCEEHFTSTNEAVRTTIHKAFKKPSNDLFVPSHSLSSVFSRV